MTGARIEERRQRQREDLRSRSRTRPGRAGISSSRNWPVGFTADAVESILENSSPKIASLFKDDPVFSSDVHGDASGVLLADVPRGTYVLMCRRTDLAAQGPHFAAQISAT